MTSIFRLVAAAFTSAVLVQQGFLAAAASSPGSGVGCSQPTLMAQTNSSAVGVPPSAVIPAGTAVSPSSELRGPIGATSVTSTDSGTVSNVIEPPRVGPSDASTAAQAAQSLTGLANITSVTANAITLPRLPLPQLRDGDVQFVQISLRNDSQQVAVINGDASQATVGSATTPAVGGRYLVQNARPSLTKKKVEAITAVTLGSFALAGPIFYEFITPGQHRDRSLGEAIGADGTRHRVEADRFGVRVLMPGDESVGWMAFACQPDQSIKTVTIPLSFSRSLTPDGVLEVPVKVGDSGALQPQNSAINQQAAAEAIKDAQKSAQDSGAPRQVPGADSMLEDQTVPGQRSTTQPGQ